MTRLSLRRADLDEIDALREFADLVDLDLRGTGAIDLGPLEGATRLEILTPSWQTEDVAPLAGLPRLRELDLRGTGVTDGRPLADLPGLVALDLSASALERPPPLAGLTSLEHLAADWTPLAPADLAGAPASLRSLSVRGTDVDDLAFVARCPALTRLDISFCPVRDLRPLTGLGDLSVLHAAWTEVRDVCGMPRLGSLDVRGTAVSRLDELADIGPLSSLRLDDSLVGDLSPLADARQLHTLHAARTPIDTVEALADLQELTDLDLSDTGVADLAPLAPLRSVARLSLAGTPITDLAPLADWPIVRHLDLSRTGIRSLEALHRWRPRSIDLSGSAIEDLSSVAAIGSRLEWLSVAGTQVENIESLAEARGLRTLVVDKQLELTQGAALAALRRARRDLVVETVEPRRSCRTGAPRLWLDDTDVERHGKLAEWLCPWSHLVPGRPVEDLRAFAIADGDIIGRSAPKIRLDRDTVSRRAAILHIDDEATTIELHPDASSALSCDSVILGPDEAARLRHRARIRIGTVAGIHLDDEPRDRFARIELRDPPMTLDVPRQGLHFCLRHGTPQRCETAEKAATTRSHPSGGHERALDSDAALAYWHRGRLFVETFSYTASVQRVQLEPGVWQKVAFGGLTIIKGNESEPTTFHRESALVRRVADDHRDP